MLRHAESIKGAGLSLGTTSRNSGLTENGKKEITRMAKSIKRFNVKFDAISTSPLNSAMQTAKIISSTFQNKRWHGKS